MPRLYGRPSACQRVRGHRAHLPQPNGCPRSCAFAPPCEAGGILVCPLRPVRAGQLNALAPLSIGGEPAVPATSAAISFSDIVYAEPPRPGPGPGNQETPRPGGFGPGGRARRL